MVVCFLVVDDIPVKFQLVRIEIHAVDRIRKVLFAETVLVEIEVGAGEITDEQCSFVVDLEPQLKPLFLHSVVGHWLKVFGYWHVLD